VRERRLRHVLEHVAGKHEIDTGVFQEVEAGGIADVTFYAFVAEPDLACRQATPGIRHR
jgi:hypothetical protein